MHVRSLLNELTLFFVENLRFASHCWPISKGSYILGTFVLIDFLVLKWVYMFLLIGRLKPIREVFVGQAVVVIRRVNLCWFLKLQRKLIWKHFLNVWAVTVFWLGIGRWITLRKIQLLFLDYLINFLSILHRILL